MVVRARWEKALLTALVCGGVAWGQQTVTTTPMHENGNDSIVTLREQGKPEQKCKVLKSYRSLDGTTVSEVQDLKTGERLTISESAPTGGTTPSASKTGILGGLFRRSQPTTTTTTTTTTEIISQKPTVTAPATSGFFKKLTPGGAMTSTDAGGKPAAPAMASRMEPKVETAQPGDWHQSWGKMETHKAAKVTKDELPSAVNVNEDPLKNPSTFSPAMPGQQVTNDQEKVQKSSTTFTAPKKTSGGGLLNLFRRSSTQESSTEVITKPAPAMPTKTGSPFQSSTATKESTSRETFVPAPAPKTTSMDTKVKPADGSSSVPATGTPYPTLPSPSPYSPAGLNTPQAMNRGGWQVPAASGVASAPRGPSGVAPMPQAPVQNNIQSVTYTQPFHEKPVAGSGEFASTTVDVAGTYHKATHAKSSPQTMSSERLKELENILRSSSFPSQREWAAEALGTADWHASPRVVTLLLQSAKEDPSPTVRVACLRCLTKMQANTATVRNTVQSLKADIDPRVRTEANFALAMLSDTGRTK
jgi:hypothetical protein